ncbi:MAG TPA: hypothetical protein VMU05_16180 [Dongiaceae bacterium]|nr:hypothetical protein [Dongiaceae bacterium]
MAWVTVSCPDGFFEINVDGITRIIRSYAYARALKENSQTHVETHWFGPNLETVDVDWKEVTKQREIIAKLTADDLYFKLSTGMDGHEAMEYLEGLLDDRDDYMETFHDMQADAGKHTMANIEQSVQRGEYTVEGLTLLRDACAETELVLATGGAGALGLEVGSIGGIALSSTQAAVGGITVGSLMKGGFKWQDTNSFGQGVAEASIELVINLATFGIGQQIPRDVVGSSTARLVVGLVFGEMKGAFKIAPDGYLSPEDIAKGKKRKSDAQLLIPAAANIPSGIARQMMEGLMNGSGWAIPATVVVKLGLKYGAKALASPSPPKPSFAPAPPTKPQRDILRDLALLGRTNVTCAVSNGWLDCSGPEEEFVTLSAIRPEPVVCR